jgi:hypothetical protein
MENNNIRSIISGGRRYEIEVKPFLGPEGGYVGTLWQMDGLTRVHCCGIKYGATEQEVNNKIDQYVVSLQFK